MSSRFEPKIDRLVAALSAGLGAEETEGVRDELGLSGEADDRDVARSLVQIVAACRLAEAGRVAPKLEDEAEENEDVEESDEIPAADASLLGRIEAGGRDQIAIDQLDLTTLLGVLRVGTLRQRRGVVRFLHEKFDGFARDEIRAVTKAIESTRDVEIGEDLARLNAKMSGARGRTARSEREKWRKSANDLEEKIAEFWDGEQPVEPIGDLPGDERAQLLLRARELPDVVVHHLTAVLEGVDGTTSREDRRALVASLRYAGDPRLVPTLVSLLDSSSAGIVTEAARALRRVEDTRVTEALARTYERTVVDATKAILAGALGEHGDRRGADYVRELLDREDVEVQLAALEALETLGAPEDAERVTQLLDERRLAKAAVHTLARIADGRALKPLAKLALSVNVSAVQAAIEESRTTIIARMELRGEDIDDHADDTTAIRLSQDVRAPRTSFGAKFKAFRYYFIGQLWIAFGGLKRGVRRLEQAAQFRPDWGRPWIAIAMTYAHSKRHAKALAAFRRAIETDRRLVERNPLFVRALAQCFLRRAEQLDRDGRRDVARGLLGEALDLDLRRAPSAVRFELQRRSRALQRTAT